MQFTQDQLQALAEALADTDEGLTGTEIGHLLASCEIADFDPQNTKWKRLSDIPPCLGDRRKHEEASEGIAKDSGRHHQGVTADRRPRRP